MKFYGELQGVAWRPTDYILVTIRIAVWIQESEVRNPDSLDYRSIMLAFGGGLYALGALLVLIYNFFAHKTGLSSTTMPRHGSFMDHSWVTKDDQFPSLLCKSIHRPTNAVDVV